MFSVMIEPYDGQFAATLLGAPTIRAVGATRDDALRALHTDLAQRLAQGEFVAFGGSVCRGYPTSQAPTAPDTGPTQKTSAPKPIAYAMLNVTRHDRL